MKLCLSQWIRRTSHKGIYIFVLVASLFSETSLSKLERPGSWLVFVMFIVILLLSHLVSWDMCVT